jgi:hypothetical protein
MDRPPCQTVPFGKRVLPAPRIGLGLRRLYLRLRRFRDHGVWGGETTDRELTAKWLRALVRHSEIHGAPSYSLASTQLVRIADLLDVANVVEGTHDR